VKPGFSQGQNELRILRLDFLTKLVEIPVNAGDIG
jgi:hypothetical protein